MTGTKLSNIQLLLHYETHLKQTSKLQVEVDGAERNRNNVTYLVGISHSFYITTSTGYLLIVIYIYVSTQIESIFYKILGNENGIPLIFFLLNLFMD